MPLDSFIFVTLLALMFIFIIGQLKSDLKLDALLHYFPSYHSANLTITNITGEQHNITIETKEQEEKKMSIFGIYHVKVGLRLPGLPVVTILSINLKTSKGDLHDKTSQK